MKISNTLGTKLLRMIFGVYFIITLCITVVQCVIEYLHVKEKIASEIRSFQMTFSPGLTKALWSFDKDQIDSIIFGMKEISTISGVEITDLSNRVVSSAGETSKNAGRAAFKQLFEFKFPIKYTDVKNVTSTIGYCSIFSNNIVVIERVQYGFFLIIINSLFKTTALWIIVLFFVNKFITRPINTLTELTRSINPDDEATYFLPPQVTESLSSRNDEIGILSQNYIKLCHSILQKIRELHLEERSRIAMVEDLAHRGNNPLHATQLSLENIQIQVDDIREINRLIFGPSENLGQEGKICLARLNGSLGSIQSDSLVIREQVLRMAEAINEIRALSGIDGHNLVRVNIEQVIEKSFERLKSYRGIEIVERRFKREANGLMSHDILSNCEVLVICLERWLRVYVERLKNDVTVRLRFESRNEQIILLLEHEIEDRILLWQELEDLSSSLNHLLKKYGAEIVLNEGAEFHFRSA